MGLKAMEPYSTYYGAGDDLLTDEAMDSWVDSLSRGKPLVTMINATPRGWTGVDDSTPADQLDQIEKRIARLIDKTARYQASHGKYFFASSGLLTSGRF